jgi:hypothetical protein
LQPEKDIDGSKPHVGMVPKEGRKATRPSDRSTSQLTVFSQAQSLFGPDRLISLTTSDHAVMLDA